MSLQTARAPQVPPAHKQRCASKVLEEDVYQEALSDIIKRDFFPEDAEEATPEEGKKSIISNLSLDQFQMMYTSEDNASFIDLLNTQNQQRRDAYSWAWNQNKLDGARVKAIAARQSATNSANDEQLSGPAAWPFNPMNTLMFYPETDFTKKQNTSAEDTNEKSIAYHATRLPATFEHSTAQPVPLESQDEEPRVAGWTFVDPAPSPSPETFGRPQMTWGEIVSTPIRLPETPQRTFKMPDVPAREALHHRITEQLKRKNRAKTPATRLKEIPKFSSSPDLRRAMLSPGGQRLLAASGHLTSALRQDLKTPRTSLLKNVTTIDVTPRAD